MSPNYSAPISIEDLNDLKLELKNLGVDPENLYYNTLPNNEFLVKGVVIPLGGENNICLTFSGGVWFPSLRQVYKEIRTLSMHGFDYTDLIEAVKGAVSAKSALPF
jgi:hypothetical protein